MTILFIAFLLGAILLSLTVHEVAHGLAAWHYGDSTAKNQGRLSLNPLKHLDPIGTIMLIVTTLIFKLPFGWAKPVPVNPMELANPRRDMAFVALAGPASNLLLAVILGLLFRFSLLSSTPENPLSLFLIITVQINLALAFFNLIPIHPLDGDKIVVGLLPFDKALLFRHYSRFMPQLFFGIIILGMVIQQPLLFNILSPISKPWFTFWNSLLGMPGGFI